MNKTRNELLEEILANISSGGGIASMQIQEESTAYTILILDDVVVGDASTPFTATLPPLSTALKSVTIKSTIGGGTLTLDGDGSETIDGALTQAITAGTSITVTPTSIGWVIT